MRRTASVDTVRMSVVRAKDGARSHHQTDKFSHLGCVCVEILESNPVLLRCAELRSFAYLRCPAACHHICDDSHQHQRMDLKVRCGVLRVTNCGRIPSQKTVMCVSQGFQRRPVFTSTTGMVCHSRSIALTSASVTYSNARALAAFSGQLSWG